MNKNTVCLCKSTWYTNKDGKSEPQRMVSDKVDLSTRSRGGGRM